VVVRKPRMGYNKWGVGFFEAGFDVAHGAFVSYYLISVHYLGRFMAGGGLLNCGMGYWKEANTVILTRRRSPKRGTGYQPTLPGSLGCSAVEIGDDLPYIFVHRHDSVV